MNINTDVVSAWRSAIDDEDAEILRRIIRRARWVRRLHEATGATEPRYDYARETAIHEKYAEAFEAAGIPRIHAHRVAAAVIDAGKAAVRASGDQA